MARLPQRSLYLFLILLTLLVFGISNKAVSDLKTDSHAKAVFYVHWYDVGKSALEGLNGVSHVTNGFQDFKEINTVFYDPEKITIEDMVKALKDAGTIADWLKYLCHERSESRRMYRQGKPNTGFTVVNLSTDLPIVRLDQLFDDGQADPRTTMFPWARFLTPIKALKNIGEILFANVDTRVDKNNLNVLILPSR